MRFVPSDWRHGFVDRASAVEEEASIEREAEVHTVTLVIASGNRLRFQNGFGDASRIVQFKNFC